MRRYVADMTPDPQNDLSSAIYELRHELREVHADLKRRLDGNTLTLNLLAGRVYKLQARVDELDRP